MKELIKPKSSIFPPKDWGPLFIAPSAIVLILIITYPLLYACYISLFNTNFVSRWDFVGGSYYRKILGSPDFYRSIGITFKFTFLVVVGHFIVGGILALVLNDKFPGRTFTRAILLLPWVLPDVSVALIWKWILNPVYGIVNNALMRFGLIEKSIEWFSNGNLAFISIVFISIWKGYALIMVLVLAGLQSIPVTLYEAAAIDGANGIQRFWYITIPALKPILLSALILDTVWWFKHFTIVWLSTTGGPDGATNLISIDIFKQAFEYSRFGEASAMAVVVFFICFAIGYFQRKVLEK